MFIDGLLVSRWSLKQGLFLRSPQRVVGTSVLSAGQFVSCIRQ
jgi:hypothetical protein